MTDKTTWITREQAEILRSGLDRGIDADAFLRALNIKVEDDRTVADDELSDATIYKLAHGFGYYIGADVTARDIARRMPWLTPERCDDVASKAAEYLGDSDNIGEARSYAIEASVEYLAEDDPTYSWNPNDPDAAPFTDAEGKVWTVGEVSGGWKVVRCSDGRMFEESGSEWERLEEAKADA